MNLTRLLPTREEIDLDGGASRDALARWYAPPEGRWLRLNLVATVDGRSAGGDGTSDSLTNRVDRAVLGVIRRAADAVLVGASSVRIEGYRMPAQATLAVATMSGDLSGHGFDPRRDRPPAVNEGAGRSSPTRPLLVLAPDSARAAVERSLGAAPYELEILDAREGRIAPDAMLTALRRRGHESIVCEGGPTLAGQFIEAGLVDELCLTTSPAVGGTAARILDVDSPTSGLRLTHVLVDDSGALYARWRFPAR